MKSCKECPELFPETKMKVCTGHDIIFFLPVEVLKIPNGRIGIEWDLPRLFDQVRLVLRAVGDA